VYLEQNHVVQSNQKRNIRWPITCFVVIVLLFALSCWFISSQFDDFEGRWESVAINFHDYRQTPDTRNTLLVAERFITKNKDPITMPMGLALAAEARWEAGIDEKAQGYLSRSLDACLKSKRYVGALNVYAIKANMALRSGDFDAANIIVKEAIGLLDKLAASEPENYDTANRTAGWLSNPFQVYLNLCSLYLLQNDPEGARLVAAGVVDNDVEPKQRLKTTDRRRYELFTAFAAAASYETGHTEEARRYAALAQHDWVTDIVPMDDDEFLAIGTEGPGLDIWTLAGCDCLKAGDYELTEKFFDGHEGLAYSQESIQRHARALLDIANPHGLQPYLDPLHNTIRYLFTSGNDAALRHILEYLEQRVKNFDVRLDIQTEEAMYASRLGNKRLAAKHRHDALETARVFAPHARAGSAEDSDYSPEARWCLIFITNYAIMDGDFEQARQALSLLEAHDTHPDHSHANAQRRASIEFFSGNLQVAFDELSKLSSSSQDFDMQNFPEGSPGYSHLALGNVYTLQGESRKAIDAYNAARELAEQFASTPSNLDRLHGDINNLATIHLALAAAYEKAGQPKQALQEVHKVMIFRRRMDRIPRIQVIDRYVQLLKEVGDTQQVAAYETEAAGVRKTIPSMTFLRTSAYELDRAVRTCDTDLLKSLKWR
jgi:tetratricopeptide (TPR) repeat protein